MSEPEITKDEEDVEGHKVVAREAAPGEDDALDAPDEGDDDVAGHTGVMR